MDWNSWYAGVSLVVIGPAAYFVFRHIQRKKKNFHDSRLSPQDVEKLTDSRWCLDDKEESNE